MEKVFLTGLVCELESDEMKLATKKRRDEMNELLE